MTNAINVSMNAANESPEAIAARSAHDVAMAAVADASASSVKHTDNRDGKENLQLSQETPPAPDAGAPAAAARPDNIPEKFWNAEKGEVNLEALLKSQADAEAALLAATKKPAETQTPEEAAAAAAAAAEEGQATAVTTASAEYAEKGELSDATYENLAKQGLSRDMVNDYIAGQKAIVSSLQNAAFSEFGGTQEGYAKAADWARENLNESEIAALDVQLTSTDPAIVSQGAKSLQAKYAANADITPVTTVIGLNAGNVADGSYYKSSAEMQADMANKLYKTDGAFRQKVADKIARASAANVKLFG